MNVLIVPKKELLYSKVCNIYFLFFIEILYLVTLISKKKNINFAPLKIPLQKNYNYLGNFESAECL
jgi:hypothetical protein